MKILVYGFKPRRPGKQGNISEKVIKRLKPRHGVVKVVFPTAFDREGMLETAARIRPEAIIGLGQCSRGKRPRLEVLAKNRMKVGRVVSTIDPEGPKQIRLAMPRIKGDWYRVSRSAGAYVCNYSMYVLGEYARQHKVKMYFLHLPKSFPLTVAVERIHDFVSAQNP